MKKTCIIILLNLLIFLLIVLTACKSSPLEGTRWSLVGINESELIGDTYISLDFFDGKISGYGGCNDYIGKFSTKEPGVLNIQGPGAETEMACREDINEQEDKYFTDLGKAETYEVTADTLVVHVRDSLNSLVFSRIPGYRMDPSKLVGTSWQFESWDGVPVPDGLSITLNFDRSKQASGFSGKYGYKFDYTAKGDRLTSAGFSSWITNNESPKELVSYSLRYTDNIARINQYNLSGDRLEIFTSRGDIFVYKPLENPDDSQ